MSPTILLAAHTVVLGCWLGSDLVINSEYRFIVHRSDLPVAARQEMTDHLMKVDQHVRYALVLQAMLGTMLLAGLGLVPAWIGDGALFAGLGWLGLVEATHRTRQLPLGQRLALLDRGVRYVLALALTQGDWPGWLRLKLALFAGVIGCGVLIRFQLIRHFAVWSAVLTGGSTPEREAALRATYRRATSILAGLWTLVLAIALLAVLRPF
jgi:hypothetical protein